MVREAGVRHLDCFRGAKINLMCVCVVGCVRFFMIQFGGRTWGGEGVLKRVVVVTAGAGAAAAEAAALNIATRAG